MFQIQLGDSYGLCSEDQLVVLLRVLRLVIELPKISVSSFIQSIAPCTRVSA